MCQSGTVLDIANSLRRADGFINAGVKSQSLMVVVIIRCKTSILLQTGKSHAMNDAHA